MIVLRLILLLGICVRATIESQDCTNTNAASYCYSSTSFIRCYINSNDTQSIKELIYYCASSSVSLHTISVYKNYVSNEDRNLLVDIELPSNILTLRIYNREDDDHNRLTTSNQNAGLTRIYISSYTGAYIQGVKKLISSSITSHIICRLLRTKESFQLLVGKP